MAVSEKQHQANARNAQLSTGPKTQAGKFRSRRNAIKHGLTASPEALAEADAAEVRAEIDAFARTYKPRDPVEHRLVEQAALASVRHNRARARADALTRLRRDAALRDYDGRRRDEVRAAMGRLDRSPGEALPALWRTAEGCDALCDAWDELSRQLEEQGRWGPAARNKAVAMLGYHRAPPDDAPPRVREFMRAALATQRSVNEFDRIRYFGGSRAEGPDPAESLVVLKVVAMEEVMRLSALAEENWRKYDEPARSSAAGAALVELEGEAAKLRRYQAEAAREMRQALNGLAAHRRERRRMEQEERRRAEEEAPARNEPISPVAEASKVEPRQEVAANNGCAPAAPPPADPRPEPPATAAPDPIGHLADSPDGAEIDRPIPIR